MIPYRTKPARIIALTVRILVGLLFVVSAVAKLVDMDRFEIHVFSYGLLSMNVSFFVARLIVIAELLVGVGLMTNIWHRFVNVCAILMLAGFTVFLCYAMLVGRTDSFQCMGRLMDIDPARSVLKNVVLMMLLYVGMHCRPFRWNPRWFLWLPGVLAPVVAVFCISAPDNWLFGPSEEVYGAVELRSSITEGELSHLNLDKGRHVLAFIHPKCRFCQMAMQKIGTIQQRNGLPEEAFVFVEPAGDTLDASVVDTSTFHRPINRMSTSGFVKITYGQFPVLFLMEDGEVYGSAHYRNIDESQIVEFLSPNDEKE